MKLIITYRNGNTVTRPDIENIEFYRNIFTNANDEIRFDTKYSVGQKLDKQEMLFIEKVEIVF